MPAKAGIALQAGTPAAKLARRARAFVCLRQPSYFTSQPLVGARSRAMRLSAAFRAKSFRPPVEAELLLFCLSTCTQDACANSEAGPKGEGQNARSKREVTKRKRHPAWRLPGSCPTHRRTGAPGRAAGHRATAPALPQLEHPCPRHGPHSVRNRCAVARAKEPRCKVAELGRWFCCYGCLLSATTGRSQSRLTSPMADVPKRQLGSGTSVKRRGGFFCLRRVWPDGQLLPRWDMALLVMTSGTRAQPARGYCVLVRDGCRVWFGTVPRAGRPLPHGSSAADLGLLASSGFHPPSRVFP
jgi:hypothetical protein